MARLKLSQAAIGVGFLVACVPAMAEPISVIGAIVAYAAPAAYTGYILAATAIIAAASSSAKARRQQRAMADAARNSYNASLQDRNVTSLGSEASWKVIYGSPAPVGGSLLAIFTSGAKDQYKHLVIAFAAHECAGIDEIYIEGEPVGARDAAGWATGGMFSELSGNVARTDVITLDANGSGRLSMPTSAAPGVNTNPQLAGYLGVFDSGGNDATTSFSISPDGLTLTALAGSVLAGQVITVSYQYLAYASRVNCQVHLSPGGVDTADSYLSSVVPQWTGNHKLSGFTYVVITLDLNFGRFQGGPPNITARIRGKKIYDWRTGTYVLSNNPALCAGDFITSTYGMSAQLGQVDSAAMIAAANACDAQGFTCDGVIDSSNGRDANLAMIEDAMAGATHFSGGVWRVLAGAWQSPVMTLSDNATLAGAIEVNQASNTADARYSGVRGQYVRVDGLGVSADIPPYSVASYVAADGYPRFKDLTFPLTGSASICTKLAAIAVEQSRLGLTITYPAHMSAWALQPGDRVYVNNGELGFVNKTFRVVDWSFDTRQAVQLVLTEDTANVYTGTFNVPDYQQVTSNLADPFARPAAPASLAAASGTNFLLRMGDGTIVTRVSVTWSPSTVRSVLQGGYAQLQWRLATALDDQWQSVDLPAELSSYLLQGPQDGTAILLRLRFVTGLNVYGTWANIAHKVVGKTAPPTTPGFVSATQSLVFWGAVNDADLAGYRIRAFPGQVDASVWSKATPLHNDILTTGPWPISTRLYGVQTILVASEDTTGNQSPPAYTVLDFGQPDLSNAVASRDYGALGFPGTVTNGSVSGTSLVANADAASDRYGLADLYGEADNYATSYLPLTWVSDTFIPPFQGGTVALNQVIQGSSSLVEYQIDGSTLNDDYALADDYAAADLDGASSQFSQWPNALGVNRMQGLIFRVSVAGGSTQGQITSFVPALVMPDVRQTFGNVTVAAAGTRLPPAAGTPPRTWIAIKTLQVTPVVDGGGAIAGRILDFSPTLGPLIQLVDITGSPVAGRSTVDIGGLADG